jgi:hypothetical protein
MGHATHYLCVAHGDGERRSRTVERVETRETERESQGSARGSSDLTVTRVGGAVTAHKCTTVGDWESGSGGARTAGWVSRIQVSQYHARPHGSEL